jgi:transposase
MSVYVGIDAHRKRSQVAVVAEDGQVQLNRKRGERLRAVPAADRRPTFRGPPVRSRPHSAEPLEDHGFDPHMVHPLWCKAISSARLKNDKGRRGDLGAAAARGPAAGGLERPAKVRQLRALVRHRISLVRLGTQLRNRIHAVAADHCSDRSASYRAGPGRAEAGWPSWTCPRRRGRSSPTAWR